MSPVTRQGLETLRHHQQKLALIAVQFLCALICGFAVGAFFWWK